MAEKRFTCETKTQGCVSIDLMKDNGQIIEKFEAINLLNELHEENQRLTNKLNNTALELVDDVISNGKAVEISEMSYHEFLEYRAKNNKHMELQI